MREKQSKRNLKGLLMAVSVVLVAAISIGATLAYLTAQTAEKQNTFKASSPDLTGQTLEPSMITREKFFMPGETFNKDPMVQNTTLTENAYVGARVRFFINVDKDSNNGTELNVIPGNDSNKRKYVEVDYTTAQKYITLHTNVQKYQVGTASSDTGFNTTSWTDVTTDTRAKTGADQLASYFIYKKALGNKVTSSVGAIYDPDTSGHNGNDVTDPLFTSVTFSKYINLPEEIPASGDDVNKIVQNVANGTAPAIGIKDVDTLTQANQYNYIFKNFDLKIIVDSYGYKTSDAAGTALSGDTAIGAIETGLANYDQP